MDTTSTTAFRSGTIPLGEAPRMPVGCNHRPVDCTVSIACAPGIRVLLLTPSPCLTVLPSHLTTDTHTNALLISVGQICVYVSGK